MEFLHISYIESEIPKVPSYLPIPRTLASPYSISLLLCWLKRCTGIAGRAADSIPARGPIVALDLTGSSCEKCKYLPSGRNRTCGPAIPVQRSNQLSLSIYRSVVQV